MTLTAPDQRTATEDRCEWSDLPAATCSHCHPTRVTTLDQLEAAVGHRLERWAVQPRPVAGREQPSPWAVGTDDPAVINCDHPTSGNRTLCDQCEDRLTALLTDIPALLVDLEVAETRQVRFVDHGTLRLLAPQRHPWTDELDETKPANRLPDTYRLAGFAKPAAWARRRLAAALAGPMDRPASPGALVAAWAEHLSVLLLDDQMPRWVRRLSEAVIRAREVIDCPPDARFIGPCPRCNRDVYAAALGDKASDEDRAAQTVQCACGAPIRVRDRLDELLAEYDDKLLTTAELVGAVADWSGEPITRGRIDWWVKTGRLASHQRELARYVPLAEDDPPEVEWSGRPGHKLVMDTETAYRVSDVRALAAQVAERRKA